MRFLYWATAENGVKVNFISENFFEEGAVVDYKGVKVTINDLAVEEDISCEELLMQREDMRYCV
jgi:hypothetical protein